MGTIGTVGTMENGNNFLIGTIGAIQTIGNLETIGTMENGKTSLRTWMKVEK